MMSGTIMTTNQCSSTQHREYMITKPLTVIPAPEIELVKCSHRPSHYGRKIIVLNQHQAGTRWTNHIQVNT